MVCTRHDAPMTWLSSNHHPRRTDSSSALRTVEGEQDAMASITRVYIAPAVCGARQMESRKTYECGQHTRRRTCGRAAAHRHTAAQPWTDTDRAALAGCEPGCERHGHACTLRHCDDAAFHALHSLPQCHRQFFVDGEGAHQKGDGSGCRDPGPDSHSCADRDTAERTTAVQQRFVDKQRLRRIGHRVGVHMSCHRTVMLLLSVRHPIWVRLWHTAPPVRTRQPSRDRE
jgi:hypothetical protein